MLATGTEAIDTAEADLAAALAIHPHDAAACAAALEQAIALTRTDAAEYFDRAELYDYLAEEYEHLGRVDDALAAMREAIAAGWDGQPEGRSRLAEIMMRAGRVDEATALDWLTDVLALALKTGDPERLVGQLSEFRATSLAALDRQPDEFGEPGRTVPRRPARATPAVRSGGGGIRSTVGVHAVGADVTFLGIVSPGPVRAGAGPLAGPGRTGIRPAVAVWTATHLATFLDAVTGLHVTGLQGDLGTKGCHSDRFSPRLLPAARVRSCQRRRRVDTSTGTWRWHIDNFVDTDSSSA